MKHIFWLRMNREYRLSKMSKDTFLFGFDYLHLGYACMRAAIDEKKKKNMAMGESQSFFVIHFQGEKSQFLHLLSK